MRRMMAIVIFVVVFALGLAFSAINTAPVNINYYLGVVTLPLSVIVILSLVAGIIIGSLTIFASTLRLRYENHYLQKKLDISEQEINSLRILPIKDQH